MDQRPLQHPGDDLHVLMRVGLEAGARAHPGQTRVVGRLSEAVLTALDTKG
ncbi:hypothetical protein [Actinoplanes sp. NPDC020271]|uniref:hypothetical protein n=1 Tax=Actinoplanes sp. NPDC020271 TaxID=3363896 RepID=UPI0037978B24